ncbi:uncharacterized protein TRAVEDRAFT_44095 [Trametes versicolor FP-101664 SS1]|uniref:uncharacterized protein n=1 Tax=Trametes versicolor (strain FP-101664) TaxID=717944 RepID=UPI00046212E7|nr:uncharacterized protein TRAVEDRAFT_44095 [Trametes versicolor FP-101664 SS1]EIW61279.1 hypothetical protein TRAVEDRAFT_44095 [Trametes versicolor FP-101664 SS1]
MDVSLYAENFVEACCDFTAFTLIFYEYLITIDREIDQVWGRRFTGATALFWLNRYLALLKYPVYIVAHQALSDMRYTRLVCHAVNIYSMVVQILPYVVWTAFSTLRIYAICGNSWKMALLVLIPGSVQIASNIYLYSQTSAINYPLPIGCFAEWLIPTEIYVRRAYGSVLIATRASVIVNNVLVIALTWWKTYGIRKLVAQANMKVSLSTLLLRDGTIYFLLLFIMSIFHIVFSLTERFTYTLTLEEPLTAILVSRFLLNLREADGSRSLDDLDTMISFPSFARHPNDSDESTPHFVASFIGPLGAPLDHTPISQDDASIAASTGTSHFTDARAYTTQYLYPGSEGHAEPVISVSMEDGFLSSQFRAGVVEV